MTRDADSPLATLRYWPTLPPHFTAIKVVSRRRHAPLASKAVPTGSPGGRANVRGTPRKDPCEEQDQTNAEVKTEALHAYSFFKRTLIGVLVFTAPDPIPLAYAPYRPALSNTSACRFRNGSGTKLVQPDAAFAA